MLEPGKRAGRTYLGLAMIVSLILAALTVTNPAYSNEDSQTASAVTASSDTLTTWMHENAIATSEPVEADQVRQSQFYEASVSTTAEPESQYDSFVYMSVPRSGKDKQGYTDEDGAEFASDAGFTMSWTSFEYATDVWVSITLTTGQSISSADQVTIRPSNLELDKELVDGSTIRVKVPHSPDGLRFSVEFDPQLVTVYNDQSGISGQLTLDPESGRAVHTEPQNAVLVFANPKLTEEDAPGLIPTEASGTIHRPDPGLVNDLNDIAEEIIYFEPGTYYMGSDYHALLPEHVKWVYLAPGAYVKGAFQFKESAEAADAQPAYKVTGYGVLSGEMYVYEPDTKNNYLHSTNDNCHGDCVKMLQFQSANTGQTLDIDGITVNEPPYHSFVVYAHENGQEVRAELAMNVENYKQVGAWYWQTDGLELYKGTVMRNTFFHANDDVLKLYHPDVSVDNTVIWKNENGPVIQWGWGPREISDVQVSNTDIIHNRMYWRDVKTNTCIFNSSPHWEDPMATDRADTAQTVKNMTFTNTRVEGALNCAIRIHAMANLENIDIDGLEIDQWNDLPLSAQESHFTRQSDSEGRKVVIGNEITERNGLRLHNYTVGGTSILKAGNNWAGDELGRLAFDGELWDNWNATSDDQPTGAVPTLTIEGPADNATVDSREISFEGSTDADHLSIRVNGIETEVPLDDGWFAVDVTLPEVTNRVVFTATGSNGVMNVDRRTLHAYGTSLGSLTDPAGDDNGPGSYLYPTNSAFNPEGMDLTSFEVYQDGDVVRFVTDVAGVINNPWGGDGMSTQRVHIYLSDDETGSVTGLLPGTNMSASGAWNYAIVVAGRHQSSQLGAGLFTPDLERVGEVSVEVDPAGRIFASVPADLLDDVDLQNIGYQVSMFADAEDGEGIGNIRPVFSTECAQGIGCDESIGQFYPSGGAGIWTGEIDARDTDTSDANALDIFSGDMDQSIVMDWRAGPVVAPYIHLDTPGGDITPTPTPTTSPTGTPTPTPTPTTSTPTTTPTPTKPTPTKPAPDEQRPGLPSTGN